MSELIPNESGKWSSASFRIGGETFEPAEIEALLGLEATRVRLKGERVSSRHMTTRRNSVWILKSPLGNDCRVEEHLNWLLDSLEPKSEVLRALAVRFRLDFFCGFSSENGQGGFSLSPALLVRLANLGIPVEVDLYPPGPIEEPEDSIEM